MRNLWLLVGLFTLCLSTGSSMAFSFDELSDQQRQTLKTWSKECEKFEGQDKEDCILFNKFTILMNQDKEKFGADIVRYCKENAPFSTDEQIVECFVAAKLFTVSKRFKTNEFFSEQKSCDNVIFMVNHWDDAASIELEFRPESQMCASFDRLRTNLGLAREWRDCGEEGYLENVAICGAGKPGTNSFQAKIEQLVADCFSGSHSTTWNEVESRYNDHLERWRKENNSVGGDAYVLTCQDVQIIASTFKIADAKRLAELQDHLTGSIGIPAGYIEKLKDAEKIAVSGGDQEKFELAFLLISIQLDWEEVWKYLPANRIEDGLALLKDIAQRNPESVYRYTQYVSSFVDPEGEETIGSKKNFYHRLVKSLADLNYGPAILQDTFHILTWIKEVKSDALVENKSYYLNYALTTLQKYREIAPTEVADQLDAAIKTIQIYVQEEEDSKITFEELMAAMVALAAALPVGEPVPSNPDFHSTCTQDRINDLRNFEFMTGEELGWGPYAFAGC